MNGRDHYRCEEPRVVDLPHDSATWDDIIVNAWPDRIDRSRSHRIVLVKPTSEPCQQAGHLLLLQQEFPGERSALISHFWHEETSQFEGRFARMIPRRLSFRRLLHYADLSRICNDRQLLCLGYQGHVHLDGINALTPQTGDHFEIHATPWDYIDSLNLFQESVMIVKPRTNAFENEEPGQNEAQQVCLNSRAMRFDACRRSIAICARSL